MAETMVRISKLPNIDRQVVSKLKDNDVITVADLWEAIGSDFPDGIKNVAKLTGVEEAKLREVLKQEAVAPQAKFVGRYWRELLAVVIGAILLFLLIRNAVRRHDTLVVIAPSGLSAFHVIQTGDVQPAKMFSVHDSFTAENQVIGRYLLQPVSTGAVLLNSQLGPPELKEQLNGRQVVTMPIKSAAISSTVRPASRVRLLFSPRNPDDSKTITDLIIDDVIVLAVNRQGDSSSITVALKNKDDLAKTLLLLSTSDILISEG
jgi:hypothetical protein